MLVNVIAKWLFNKTKI